MFDDENFVRTKVSRIFDCALAILPLFGEVNSDSAIMAELAKIAPNFTLDEVVRARSVLEGVLDDVKLDLVLDPERLRERAADARAGLAGGDE